MINKELIDKFYQGKCSEEEVEHILQCFKDKQNGENTIESLWESYSFADFPSTPYPSGLLSTVDQQLNNKNRKSSSYYPFQNQWLRVAVILAFAFALPFFLIREELQSSQKQIKYITKINPAGRKSILKLPDGTMVHLNAESSITYPDTFTDSVRKVLLTGEAYFDVHRNPAQPFIVSASGIDAYALGTAFNIKAYKEDAQVQVVLTEGKVLVTQERENEREEEIMHPGEEIQINKYRNGIQKQQADLRSALAWKNDLLIFNNASSEEVFASLERWYGVEITFTKNINSFKNTWRFTGEFQNENLENVLMGISYVKGFRYQIDHKSVSITL
jgi:transmembrane sensor